MSIQALAEFWEKVDGDEEFNRLMIDETPEELNDGKPIVEFAAKHGFEFSEAELKKAADAVEGKAELKDDDLASVVGGRGSLYRFGLGNSASGIVLRSFAKLRPGGLVMR